MMQPTTKQALGQARLADSGRGPSVTEQYSGDGTWHKPDV